MCQIFTLQPTKKPFFQPKLCWFVTNSKSQALLHHNAQLLAYDGKMPHPPARPLRPGVEYWLTRPTEDLFARWLLERRFLSGVKTLVLAFIGWTQQRETCIVILLKTLSASGCAGLQWLVSAIRMKIHVLVVFGWTWRQQREGEYPFLKALLWKKTT
jgi:hypothetical protein